jgi:hypothetical protein
VEQRRTAGAWLFFGSSNRRRPWISAANQMSMADNSPEKQQNSEKRNASYGTARWLCT